MIGTPLERLFFLLFVGPPIYLAIRFFRWTLKEERKTHHGDNST